MNKIEMNKKYRNRDGKEVRILCVDRNHPLFPVVALVQHSEQDQHVSSFTSDGRYWDEPAECGRDLIELGPYDHIKIDDPVVVSGTSGALFRRYFAGVSQEGKPLGWLLGGTSYTATTQFEWATCELFDSTNPAHQAVKKG